MKRNKIKIVDSLTFKGMDSLKSLKLQRNGITKLMDGAFFGLNNIEELWGQNLSFFFQCCEVFNNVYSVNNYYTNYYYYWENSERKIVVNFSKQMSGLFLVLSIIYSSRCVIPQQFSVCGVGCLWWCHFFFFLPLCLRELEHNNLTEVTKGWLYGLRMLRVLRVSQNIVGIILPDAWEFCQKLEELWVCLLHR